MIKTIYHGSISIVDNPKYGSGKPYNDYGRGFYCTEELNLAKEWSVDFQRRGFACRYLIEEDGLNILDLNSDNYCILNWMAMLLKNRDFDVSSSLAEEAREYLLKNFLPNYKGADIIMGYRADDSYFSFSQDFINGTISYGQLDKAMHFGQLGRQYMLRSREAFGRVIFDGYEVVDCREWYAKKISRDQKARQDYTDTKKNKRKKGDIFITHILDEEMKEDDVRLR